MAPQTAEAEALKAFKESIIAKGRFDETRHNDFLLYRFLRARKYDLAKAELMFLECEDWRKTVNIENIVQTYAYPETGKVFNYYPRFYVCAPASFHFSSFSLISSLIPNSIKPTN